MKRIVKRLATLKQAENFREKLYDEYDHVCLVNFPRFYESGDYVFEVK